jgi:hypothetical protein
MKVIVGKDVFVLIVGIKEMRDITGSDASVSSAERKGILIIIGMDVYVKVVGRREMKVIF